MSKKREAERQVLIATIEKVFDALPRLNDQEREELETWERKHVTGDGAYATTDWPGWTGVFKRIAH